MNRENIWTKYISGTLFTLLFTFLSTATFADPAKKSRIALSERVYEIRNPKTDSYHFRKALHKIGEYLALDVMDELQTKKEQIKTLTDVEAVHELCAEDPVLITILRAGVPLFLGMQKVFQNAPAGFIGMSRNEETLMAKTEYIGIPDVSNKTVVIIDTMIATGGSMIDAIKIVQARHPKKIFVVGAIASKKGIDAIYSYDPAIKIFTAQVDDTLNEKGYIVPGLGDAGDRAYGKKGVL